MSMDSIVQIVISRQTAVVSRPGFGVPLLCAYHTEWAERVRFYTSLQGLVDDGFAVTDAIYLMAQSVMSQDPSVQSFAVGRRALPPTQTIECTPTAQASTTYTAQINTTPYEYTSDANPTDQEIVEGLAAAVNAAAWQSGTVYAAGAHVSNDTSKVYVCRTGGTSAGSGGPTGTGTGITDNTCTWDYLGPVQAVTASEDDDVLTLTADVAGALFTLELNEDYESADLWAREDVTTDPGIATDLAAINLENANWYGLQIDSQSKAEIVAAAAWVESNKKLFVPASADTACRTAATDDVMSALKALAYERTGVIYHEKPHQYAGAAWMGEEFPKNPGASTWKFKSLAGVDVSSLSETSVTNIKAKNGNFYVEVGGINITQDGKTAKPEWIDVMRDIDWLHVNMQADVFELLANVDKVPFDQGGITLMQNTVQARLEDAVTRTVLRSDPAPTTTVPLLADIPTSDRANRHLPDIKFVGYLAGAIHSTRIDGIVAV